MLLRLSTLTCLQLEEAEQNIAQLSKMKVSLTTQLEDTRKMADEESREKSGILGKYRALEHEMDCLREQVGVMT